MPAITTETIIKSMLPEKPEKPTKTRIRKDGPQNQLILDRELESQFEQTLDLFDVYVNHLNFVDQKKYNDQEFNKIKLEIDMKSGNMIDNTTKKKTDKNNKSSKELQEDMEYDIKRIRDKLNYSIEDIKNDP